MVIFHVLGATLVVAAMAALWCESRDRGPRPTAQADTPTPAHVTAAN